MPGLILSFIAAWAVATTFAFINVYFQDTQHLLEVAAQVVFFMTPIIYFPSNLESKGYWLLLTMNPVNLFLDLIRTPLMNGQPPSEQILLAGAALTAVLVGLAAGTTAWLQKRVVFHL